MTDRAALLEQVAAIFDAELRTMLRTVWTLESDVIAKHFAERALSLAEAARAEDAQLCHAREEMFLAEYRKGGTPEHGAKFMGYAGIANECARLIEDRPITLPPIGDAGTGRVE